MGRRFVDGSVIRARMAAKDARINREMAARQKKLDDEPKCPKCKSADSFKTLSHLVKCTCGCVWLLER